MAATVVGGLSILGSVSLYTNGLRRTMLAYLVALAFVLSLSLGSLFFVLIQHLTRAGWAVLVRRPAEVFALNIVTVAALAIPIAWSAFSGQQSIYPWARVGMELQSESRVVATAFDGGNHKNPEASAIGSRKDVLVRHSQESQGVRSHLYVHQTFDALTASKTPWLNPRFFVLRLVNYFSLWTIIAGFYFRRSQSQDVMIFWSLWMLVMHYLDLVWLVMPELGSSIVFGLPELGTMLMVGSLYLLGASYIATLIALVPMGDPRLKASLTMVDAY